MQASQQPEGNAPTYRERRQHTRHCVDTSAMLYLVEVGSRMSGRLLNLSLGGCLIRTDERFPTGVFRRVEIEFCLEGIPFRLAGVTQSIRDRRNIGLRFLDMSDRKREQLIHLMREIEEELAPDVEADAQR